MTGILGAAVLYTSAEGGGGGPGGDAVISIDNATATRPELPAHYTLSSNGNISYSGGVGVAPWCSVPAATSNYEVRATLNSGSLSTGTTGSWINLGTSRTWTSAGSASLLIEIRDTATSTLQDSATVTFAVE